MIDNTKRESALCMAPAFFIDDLLSCKRWLLGVSGMTPEGVRDGF